MATLRDALRWVMNGIDHLDKNWMISPIDKDRGMEQLATQGVVTFIEAKIRRLWIEE